MPMRQGDGCCDTCRAGILRDSMLIRVDEPAAANDKWGSVCCLGGGGAGGIWNRAARHPDVDAACECAADHFETTEIIRKRHNFYQKQSGSGVQCSPAALRKWCYHQWVHVFRPEDLPTGETKAVYHPLPHCVLHAVRSSFPNPGGQEYSGVY